MVDSTEISLEKRVGMNLAARRKALGWTQEYLAQHLGVETETVSRFERGATIPSLKTLEKISRLLSIRMAELLEEPLPSMPTKLEALASLIEPLAESEQRYVIDSCRSLCQFITQLRHSKTQS